MDLTLQILYTIMCSGFAGLIATFILGKEPAKGIKRVVYMRKFQWNIGVNIIFAIASSVIFLFKGVDASTENDLQTILIFGPCLIASGIIILMGYKGPGMIVNKKEEKKIFLSKLLFRFKTYYPIVYKPLVVKYKQSENKDFQSEIFKELYFKITFDLKTMNHLYTEYITVNKLDPGEKIDYRDHLSEEFKKIFFESIGSNIFNLLSPVINNVCIDAILTEVKKGLLDSYLFENIESPVISKIKLKRKHHKFNKTISFKS